MLKIVRKMTLIFICQSWVKKLPSGNYVWKCQNSSKSDIYKTRFPTRSYGNRSKIFQNYSKIDIYKTQFIRQLRQKLIKNSPKYSKTLNSSKNLKIVKSHRHILRVIFGFLRTTGEPCTIHHSFSKFMISKTQFIRQLRQKL